MTREPMRNALFRFLWRSGPLSGAVFAGTAASGLLQKARSYMDFRRGDVAEWLKAAVC